MRLRKYDRGWMRHATHYAVDAASSRSFSDNAEGAGEVTQAHASTHSQLQVCSEGAQPHQQ